MTHANPPAPARVIVLPERDDMLARWSTADPDRLGQSMYPALLKIAGQPRSGPGIGMAVVLGIADLAKEAELTGEPDQIPPLKWALRMIAPDLITAIVDDQEVLDGALSLLGEYAPPTDR